MIIQCVCQHAFQDSVYGEKMRVHNKTTKENEYVCTVCSAKHSKGGGETDKKKSKKQKLCDLRNSELRQNSVDINALWAGHFVPMVQTSEQGQETGQVLVPVSASAFVTGEKTIKICGDYRVLGSSKDALAWWTNWLSYRPFKAGIAGSNPVQASV